LKEQILSFNLFSFFPPSNKTNCFSPPKESCKNKLSKIQIENYVKKNEPKMIQIYTFKNKEKEGSERRPQLDGQWKVSMFGGP
jgi:hypothetical protein